MRSVCLVILDGWGIAPSGPGNAVELADTPVFDSLMAENEHATLTTCGRAVGLPEGQMGNSEVGHLNLGAGQVVRQDLTRIDDAVAEGSFAQNRVLRDAFAQARERGRVHLLGLVSGGGVHASMGHLRALIDLARAEGVEDVIVHAFTDGRDTPPDSGAGYLAELDGWPARVASVIGRYFAMDRDSRWDRTRLAMDALVRGEAGGRHASSGEEAVRSAYGRGETDEFIKPVLVGERARIESGDVVVFFNFRPDRARQLTQALNTELDLNYVTLTEYREDWTYPVAFPPEPPAITLAEVLADRGLAQLHVAETEKYPHVTYFFNGGEEQPHEGEMRCLVDSPRDVPTYDHKPEMSARAAASAFADRWAERDFAFGIINFANPDMVGHTGVIEAAVKAVATVDECLGGVLEAVRAKGGVCVVTADHGNAEQMLQDDGKPDTAHSLNPVPIVVTPSETGLRDGVLADVAPTVLGLLGIPVPEQMTGKDLTKCD